MEPDDGDRGRFGILVSVHAREPNLLRVTLDRVRRDGSRWKPDGFVTYKDMTREEILEMKLSHEDLYSIGLFLMAEVRTAELRTVAEMDE
jgi:hypothetical protein